MKKVDPKMLLGLNKLSSKDEEDYTYATYLKRERNSCLSWGKPVIVKESAFEETKPPAIVFPFPQEDGFVPRDARKVLHSELYRMHYDMNPLSNYRVEMVESWTPSFGDRIIEGGRKNGVMSFILSRLAASTLLKNFLQLSDQFKYNKIVTFTTLDPKGFYEDKIQPVLTVFDIKFCIPIFNPRRCDGIGIGYELVLPKNTDKHKRLISVGYMALILSNFKDNLFYVDGVRIRSQGNLPKVCLMEMHSLTTAKIGKRVKMKRATGPEDLLYFYK